MFYTCWQVGGLKNILQQMMKHIFIRVQVVNIELIMHLKDLKIAHIEQWIEKG